MPSKKDEGRTVEIPAPDLRNLIVKIRGRTPLITDAFGSERKAALAEREKGPQPKTPKKARDPEAEWRQGLYVIAEANGQPERYGFPANGIKKSLVSAGQRFAAEHGTVLNGAIQMLDDLVEIHGSEPRMREDRRRLQGRTTSLVYRPEFIEWEMAVSLMFNASAISEAQVLNLFQLAGFAVGIGNWRPEKNGQFGQFELVGAEGV